MSGRPAARRRDLAELNTTLISLRVLPEPASSWARLGLERETAGTIGSLVAVSAFRLRDSIRKVPQFTCSVSYRACSVCALGTSYCQPTYRDLGKLPGTASVGTHADAAIESLRTGVGSRVGFHSNWRCHGLAEGRPGRYISNIMGLKKTCILRRSRTVSRIDPAAFRQLQLVCCPRGGGFVTWNGSAPSSRTIPGQKSWVKRQVTAIKGLF